MQFRRVWRKRRLELAVAVAPALLSGALRLLAKTVRVEYRNAERLFDGWARGERVIIAFWHNRAVLMPAAYRGAKMCVINSQSRDGEIATRALARWGIRSVRGSATRGGVAGFLQLVAAYREGYDLAVVPDGPRGPCYVVKPGVIHLAKTTGAPIVPVSYAAAWQARVRSWDRLIIPLPFSRVVIVVGTPIQLDRHASEGEIERQRQALEERLKAITAEAEAGVAGVR
ncbi:MAG: lysophospholipid acyltransferase family protein [Deltaproteobacteria bacterium]|nr:lysophospholipid acyltransferase family protein [Deltaproteobacteria bacterium]